VQGFAWQYQCQVLLLWQRPSCRNKNIWIIFHNCKGYCCSNGRMLILIAHKSVMLLSLCNSFCRIKVFLVLNYRKFVDWNLDVYMMCKNIICDSNTHRIFVLLTGQYMLALIHISYVRKFVLPRISEDLEIAFIFISACWVTVCHVLSQCVIGELLWVEENRLIYLVPVPSTMPDNSVCSRKQGMRSAKEYMDMVCNI